MKISEKFTIYDARQQPTGKIVRRGTPLKAGEYRMVATVLLFNDDGELLIQKRASSKIGFPNYWDYSASGQVLAQEAIYEGAERELFEELGIQIHLKDIPIRFTFSFEEGWDHYFYLQKSLTLDEVVLQKEEVQEVRFVNEEEYPKLVRSGEFIPYLFADTVFDLYHHSNEHY